MIRRTLLCALGLVLSLSLVGAASAETPTPTPDPTPPPGNSAPNNNGGVAQNNGGLLGNVGSGNKLEVLNETTPPPTSTTPAPTSTVTTTPAPTPRNCGVNAHWDPRLLRCVLDLHDRFDGRVIIIDGGPRLDVCDSDTYTVFRGRHGVYGDRLDRLFGADPIRRFGDLRRTCTSTTVIDNGDCKTLITRQTTLRNEYLGVVRRWNDGVRVYSLDRRGELDRIYSDRLRLRGDFDRVRTQRTTVCKDNGGDVINNITVAPPPVNYSVPAPLAPAPVYSVPTAPGGQVSTIPRGHAETGDGSAVIAPLG